MVGVVVIGLSVLGVLILGCFAFYHLFFLRNPTRSIPDGPVVVSPADGRVIRVEKLNQESVIIRKLKFGRVPVDSSALVDGTLVSIFMSPLNVHYNRAPLAGEVVSVEHRSGKFFNAADLNRSLLNEHTQITFDTALGKVIVVQIAGFLARRISCFLKKKQKVNKGERIGLIHMGSQTSLLLPATVTVTVEVGDRVQGGSSVIGRYSNEAPP